MLRFSELRYSILIVYSTKSPFQNWKLSKRIKSQSGNFFYPTTFLPSGSKFATAYFLAKKIPGKGIGDCKGVYKVTFDGGKGSSGIPLSYLYDFFFTESQSSKSWKTKNYLGIMFRSSSHKKRFFVMCRKRGHATANLIIIFSRKLLFKFCSWKKIFSTNFHIIINTKIFKNCFLLPL